MGSCKKATASDKGVLRPAAGAQVFTLDRLLPSAPLTLFVERFWTVGWDRRGQEPYRSEVIPHPSVQLTVESGDSPRHGYAMPGALLHGVRTRRFSVDLTGTGRVFGVKFRPGGFGAFTGLPVGAMRDRVLPLREVFGPAADRLAEAVLAEPDDHRRRRPVEDFLLQRLPSPAPPYEFVLSVVEAMLDDRSLVRVEQVTARFGVSTRTLQRLFRRYVGVGPKWVLARYRLHDATAAIDAGDVDDLAGLAHSLGWFDQAHFSRDFKEVVGVTPSEYAHTAQAARSTAAR